MKYVIDTSKEFDGVVYSSMTDNVHCDYGGETIEEIRERNPNGKFEVVDSDTVSKMLDEYIDKLCSEPFKEITEEDYWDMMECVPPARSGRDWFFVGEAFSYNVHTLCFTDGERYFSAHRKVTAPKNDIIKDINKFLSTLKKEVNNGN